MTISGKGEPETGRKVDMSHEVPSPPTYRAVTKREAMERVEMEACVGKVSGRAAFWIHGSLRPTAELFTLSTVTSGITALIWWICRVEGIDGLLTLIVSLTVCVATFLAGSAFLRRK